MRLCSHEAVVSIVFTDYFTCFLETILAELRKVKADSLVVSKVVHNNGSRGNKKESELYAVPGMQFSSAY